MTEAPYTFLFSTFSCYYLPIPSPFLGTTIAARHHCAMYPAPDQRLRSGMENKCTVPRFCFCLCFFSSLIQKIFFKNLKLKKKNISSWYLYRQEQYEPHLNKTASIHIWDGLYIRNHFSCCLYKHKNRSKQSKETEKSKHGEKERLLGLLHHPHPHGCHYPVPLGQDGVPCSVPFPRTSQSVLW